MKRTVLVGASLLLAACSTPPLTDISTRADTMPDLLPPMKSFTSAPRHTKAVKSNLDIARDFLDLSFQLESGKPMNRLTRFRGPVTVALARKGSDQFESDLSNLLGRIRNEAGIEITQSETGQPANIVVETLPRRKLQAKVPQAACFVVPRVTSWNDFRKNRGSGRLDWTTLTRRERATVFIPDDVSPQEARDCLNEEIAQALGPLNDIYRLADSIFNDDNMNSVLTASDMLVLRLYYAPQIKNGMTKAEVAKILPALLADLNPDGETAQSDAAKPDDRKWVDTIEGALGTRTARGRRMQIARDAVAMARANDWQDNRLGFSLFAEGQLALGQDRTTSVEAFKEAYKVYVAEFGVDDIHTAHVALQLAAFALSGGHAEAALEYVNQSLPAVTRAQNAGLLAAFLMIKAEVLDYQGHHADAATVRLDSLGWARYGFATNEEIRARLRETAALRPWASEPEV